MTLTELRTYVEAIPKAPVSGGAGTFTGNVTIGGALDHDGSTVGLYGVAPVTRNAAIAAPTGGTTADAEARTAINAIRTALTRVGLTS